MIARMRFSKRLKELRGGRSQAEIATILGLKQPTYASYEIGSREPSMQTLVKIADFYNVSLDTLFGRESIKDSHIKETVAAHLVDVQKEIQSVIEKIVLS